MAKRITRTSNARSSATVLVVSAAAFLASLDLFVVNIAFPDISRAFGGLDFASTSWILNAYTVVFAAFLNPFGRLGDRYGHRRVFLCGLAVFTLGSAACGISWSLPLLVTSRVVQAFGAAMLMPSSLALLLAAVPAARRAAAVSTWSAVGAMAAALGPPVGGLLLELSWRWIFFVNLPVAALAFVVGRWIVAETETTGMGMPDLLGALLIALGVGSLVWALVELPDTRSNAAEVTIAAVGAVFAIAIAIWRSARHPSPALDLAAIRVLPLWLSCIAMLLFAAAFGAMLLSSVMFLTTIWPQSPAVAGLCLAAGPVVVVVISLTLAGRLINRFGIGAVAAVGSMTYAAGIVFWLCRSGLEPRYLADFLPGQLLTGTGVGLVIPSLSAVTGLALARHRWGAGSALVNTARQLGTVVGTAVLTLVYQPGITMDSVRRGWVVVALTAAAAALAAALLAVLWRPPADGNSSVEDDEVVTARGS